MHGTKNEATVALKISPNPSWTPYSSIVKYIHDVGRHLLLFLKIRCASLSLYLEIAQKNVCFFCTYLRIT